MKSRAFSIWLILSLITSLPASEIESSIRITSIVNNSGRLQITWRGGCANKRYELEFCEDSLLNEWKSVLAWTQDGNSSNDIYLDDFPDHGFFKIVELPPILPIFCLFIWMTPVLIWCQELITPCKFQILTVWQAVGLFLKTPIVHCPCATLRVSAYCLVSIPRQREFFKMSNM